MKTAIFAGALLLAVPLAAPAAESDLYGTWKMVSQSQKLTDTGEVRQGRGKTPNGYVTFTPDGRVIGIILNDKRPKPESAAKLALKTASHKQILVGKRVSATSRRLQH